MKSYRLIFLFAVSILFLQLVLADTTLFEGDFGYRDDFIMASIPEEGIIDLCGDNSCNSGENCETCPQDCGDCIRTSGDGGIVIGDEEINKELVCEVVFNSLKEHIKKYEEINYNESELEILNIKLKEELNVRLLNNQVAALIENFDDECDKPYPILGGLTIGRFRNLFGLLIIGIVILASVIFLYFILRRSNKIKFGKKIKRRVRK
jgi:hypothetical protein